MTPELPQATTSGHIGNLHFFFLAGKDVWVECEGHSIFLIEGKITKNAGAGE